MRFKRFQMTDEARLNWLRLIRSENVGTMTFFSLLYRFGSAEKALEMLPDLSARGGRKTKICPKENAEKELYAINKMGAKLVSLCDPEYPLMLAEIADPPPLITILGNVEILNKNHVAIVGSRNSSIGGKKIAKEIAGELCKNNFCIVSGMAGGMDASAHEGALAEKGDTVAVLGTGINVPYPRENEKLYKAIAENGVIISELPLGTSPQGSNFPRRNRIISGMSRGVIIIEASLKSGSLITARMALEQGREVMAVPGSPKDPRASGPNFLIREGATLIENANDVVNALESPCRQNVLELPLFEKGDTDELLEESFSMPNDFTPPEEAREKIINNMSQTPVSIDELIRECQLTHGEVSVVVLELELAGRLERHSGNRVSLIA